MKLETEKEIEYKSTIVEIKNIIKNQERVIEELIERDIFLNKKSKTY